MRKEYPILAALIVALGLYLFFRPTDRTRYQLPTLPPVDPSTITRLELNGPSGAVALEREADAWVAGSERYPTARTAVDSMLAVVADLTVTALISESAAYDRYELDAAHRVQVTAWAGEQKVREFAVGKVAPTYRHTHVQLAGDPNVYHARESFRVTFDKDLQALRDKRVLTFDPGAIDAVRIAAAAGDVEVRRQTPEAAEGAAPAAPPPVQWTTANGAPVEAAAVERLLADLARLECDRYLDAPPEDGPAPPVYQVQLTGTGTHTLSVYPAPADQADAYPARSSDNADPFVLLKWDLDQLDEFLKTVTGAGAGPEETPPPKES
jgi:hypothetical protein